MSLRAAIADRLLPHLFSTIDGVPALPGAGVAVQTDDHEGRTLMCVSNGDALDVILAVQRMRVDGRYVSAPDEFILVPYALDATAALKVAWFLAWRWWFLAGWAGLRWRLWRWCVKVRHEEKALVRAERVALAEGQVRR